MNGTEKVLQAVVVLGIIVFLLVVVNTFAGCGSNIPIDPDCDRLIEVQDEELLSYDCSRPVEDCTNDYNEGYGDGFRDASDLCDLEGAFNEGYEAGVDSVVCEEPVECPEPPACEAYDDDVPRGHLPKECRGNGPRAQVDEDCGDDPLCPLEVADVVCETVCVPQPLLPPRCWTTCRETRA